MGGFGGEWVGLRFGVGSWGRVVVGRVKESEKRERERPRLC